MSTALILPSGGVQRSFSTPSVVRYCAIALYAVGKAEPFWLQDNGRIVIFDTKINAQDMLEQLSEGRDTIWDATGETCVYSPFFGERGKTNKAVIVTGYDVYNVPAMHAVSSETKGMAWKNHIHWGHWYRGMTERGVS